MPEPTRAHARPQVRHRLVVTCVLAALLLAGSSAAQSPPQAGPVEIMPLSEIRPGMRGVGYTVVQGTEPEAFDVEILGVLENTFPKQSLILARLSGLDLERIGVAAGMSGSPTYIDGRLIGAVSYRMGAFPTEPLAGITPIENMLQMEETEAARPDGEARNVAEASVVEAAASLLGGRGADLSNLAPASSATGLQQIATPVSIGGVDPETVRRIAPLFEAMGWQPTVGGVSQNAELAGPLQPGSAVAAHLMRGDVTFTASGTVTWASDDQVLGFGHPFLQAGSVDFPMTAAEVLTVMPSLADSQKITAAGTEVLGAIRQDRQAGILGALGTAPAMVPVTLNVDAEGLDEQFNFEMVAHKTLSPTFLFIGLSNALQSIAALSGESALEVNGDLLLDGGYDPVHIEDRFSSSAQAFFALTQTITGVYQYLYDNPFEPVGVRAVELDVVLRDDLRVADITRVWADRVDVRQGDTVNFAVWLKPYRQPEVEIDIAVRIPDDLPPGSVSVLIGDSSAVTSEEASFRRDDPAPRSVEQLIRLLNRSRPSDRIYYQISRDSEGAFYGGRRMPSLPPSVLDVLSSGQTSGDVIELDKTVLHESSEQVEYVVSGEHRIELNVRRR